MPGAEEKGINQRKEAEWQPKIKPVETVFPHVIKEISTTGKLSIDARVMLYAWAGQVVRLTGPDGTSHDIDVNQLIESQGGIPIVEQQAGRLPRQGDYVVAVSQYVLRRADKGEFDEKAINLMLSWADCPTKGKDGKPISEQVKAILQLARKRKEDFLRNQAKPSEIKAAEVVRPSPRSAESSRRIEPRGIKKGYRLESAGIGFHGEVSLKGRSLDVAGELYNPRTKLVEGALIIEGESPQDSSNLISYLGEFKQAYFDARQKGSSNTDALTQAFNLIKDTYKIGERITAFTINNGNLVAFTPETTYLLVSSGKNINRVRSHNSNTPISVAIKEGDVIVFGTEELVGNIKNRGHEDSERVLKEVIKKNDSARQIANNINRKSYPRVDSSDKAFLYGVMVVRKA